MKDFKKLIQENLQEKEDVSSFTFSDFECVSESDQKDFLQMVIGNIKEYADKHYCFSRYFCNCINVYNYNEVDGLEAFRDSIIEIGWGNKQQGDSNYIAYNVRKGEFKIDIYDYSRAIYINETIENFPKVLEINKIKNLIDKF